VQLHAALTMLARLSQASPGASRYPRCLIRQAHRIVRAVGVLVLLGLLVGGIYLHQSPSHDLQCDAFKRIQREDAGKDYWCLWPD
jgi:hypothetical protein